MGHPLKKSPGIQLKVKRLEWDIRFRKGKRTFLHCQGPWQKRGCLLNGNIGKFGQQRAVENSRWNKEIYNREESCHMEYQREKKNNDEFKKRENFSPYWAECPFRKSLVHINSLSWWQARRLSGHRFSLSITCSWEEIKGSLTLPPFYVKDKFGVTALCIAFF